MNKKGLTLVEIIVSIGLISIVMVFLFQIIMTIKKANDRQNEKTDVLITTTIITREVEKDLESFGLDKDENNLPKEPTTNYELTNTENTRNNIVPKTAENIKCLKITYDDSKVKNNEGYILYYTNGGKHFLAYKRGKGNVIETQTVREISIPPKNDFVSELINYDETQGKGYSLKITMTIQNDNIKSDLNISYAVSVSHKITIINKDGYLKNKKLELIEKTGENITINLDFNEYLYQKSVSCNKCKLDSKELEFNNAVFTMPDEDVILNVSITERPIELATYLKDIINKDFPDSNPLAEDIGLLKEDKADKNIRFRGANPNNYIEFGNSNELWRIIGVFNVYNNETNQNEDLVKIVRDKSLGSYSWDSSAKGINGGKGHNDWSQAVLMYELNCDGSENSQYCRDDIVDGFLSNIPTNTTTEWYNGTNNTKTTNNKMNATYNYSNNIKSRWADKIANVRWNLGGNKTNGDTYLTMYGTERGIATYKDQAATFDGKIGLIYPSDYGFASSLSNCIDGSTKLSAKVCKDNNWLYKNEGYWTITPRSDKYEVWYFNLTNNYFLSTDPSSPKAVYPSLYLKADTKILRSKGNGTEGSPYIIYLEDNE